MKFNFRSILTFICIILFIFLVITIYTNLTDNTHITKEKKDNKMKFELIDDVYYLNKDYDLSVYSTEYRDIVYKKINELKKNNDSLVIYNAYGINDLSVNLYLDTKKDSYVRYTISVDDEDIDDFTRVLKNDGKNNLVKKHEYQITGLVPGYVNNIKVVLLDKNDDTISKTNYEVDLTGVKKYSSRLDVYDGDLINSEGLFTLFSKDNIYLYDNDGVIRGHLLLDEFNPSKILFKDSYMYYPINKNNIVKVNRLGEVKEVYNTQYDISKAYVLDKNRIIYTSNNKIISMNINNHDTKELIDCDKLFNTKLDIVAINYIKGDIILSSKNNSSIIRINDIDNNPYIKYILSDKKLWDKDYYKYIYESKDKFFGQSDIFMNDGYINVLNNNYVNKDIYNNNKDVYDELGLKNTDKKNGTKSLYYKIKVNDKDKSYKVINNYVLPYTSNKGSLSKYKNNYIYNNSNNSFIEYNSNFEIINSYKYNFIVNKVYKYNYKNYFYK